MDTIKLLLNDARFWAALLAFVNAVVFYFIPDFPQEIWAAFNAFVGVVLTILASKSASAGATALRSARAAARGEHGPSA